MCVVIMKISIISILLISLLNCRGVGERQKLMEIARIMEFSSDSAWAQIGRMKTSGLNEADAAYYALLYTRIEDKMQVGIISDSLIRLALRYYERGRNLEQLAYCWYYQGKYFMQMQQYEDAVKALVAAEEKARIVRDYNLLGLIFTSLGELQEKQLNIKEALQSVSLSIDYFHKAGNDKNENMAVLRKGRIFLYHYQQDSCFHYMDRAEKMARTLGDTLLEAFAYYYKGCACFQQYESENALHWLLKAIELYPASDVLANHYILLSDIYYASGKLDSAAYYLKEVLSDSLFAQRNVGVYRRLGKIEVKRRNWQEAFEYTYRANLLLDSLYKSFRQNFMPDLERKYRYQQARNEILELELKNIRKERWISSLICCIAILTCVIGLLISKRKKDEAEYNFKLVSLQKKLAQQECKLAALDERDQKLKMILQKRIVILKKVLGTVTPGSRQAVDDKKVLMDILALKEWDEFCDSVNILYDGFVDYLQRHYPLLTKTELMLCCLACAGFSTVEIASYLNITESSVNNRRCDITRKAQGDKKIRFKDFIRGIKETLGEETTFRSGNQQ